LDDGEAMLLVGDDARALDVDVRVGERGDATHRLLEERLFLLADAEREVLLGMQRPAERPQARAAAAGEDDRNDGEPLHLAHGCDRPWSARSLRSAEICDLSAMYSRSLRARNDCVSCSRCRIPAGVST